MSIQRIFLIVLDSYGIGELPDAKSYGDEGSNTLGAIVKSIKYNTPNMQKLGLFNIEGVNCQKGAQNPIASFARLAEVSKGKDTTIGHWEISGIISPEPLPTYPNGFPAEVISEFEKQTGREILCNLPYSGTKVLDDYGQEHIDTGKLIVYTSADSVFQIAAHEDVVSVDKLYEYCEIARNILKGKHGVGRVIARPFIGENGNFKRTPNRHDFSLKPPSETMLDLLQDNGIATIGVGKIYDIFAGKGIDETHKIKNNIDGMNQTIALMDKDFHGLCFVNLVDFDMVYGHRNDVDGYANAATEFDVQLGEFLSKMREDDVLMITADHGCDPATPSTDHSREYAPLLVYGNSIKQGVDLKTRESFSDIAATILDIFEVDDRLAGQSFKNDILK
ncbi:phosphopentomutase [Paludicola sp. MB14-C6]|uniref:phosphopentomutase n=1 Tax=Paludihabitans sp. MB14-C6 TaxID=3070656 RepID=UPI0027DBF7B7|nr:phosphopentomutase [Paludicola sp. MB14-C6]WMJ23914.1 phosphopentomutase [Paludicola sp. MB14-C6]